MIPIEGIEVLEITQVQLPIYRWIGIFIALIVLAWSTYILIKDKLFTGIFSIFMAGLLIVVSLMQIKEGPYKEYKIQVNDYAALVEVAENYEIIESKGNIYYLRDKDGT